MIDCKGKPLLIYVPDYVVFDLETTGINVLQDEIIELSALRVSNSRVVDTYSTLVNPGRSIPWRATAVNGITNEMVMTAPVLKNVMNEFFSFTGSNVLVGHNIQTFDLKFICKAAERLYGKTIYNDYIDTLHMARRCLPQLKHHRLTDISAFFHISCEGAHRALNDCYMNQQCFEQLAKIQENITLEVCPKCGGELKKRSGKFGVFWGCSNYPGCRFTKRV